MTVSIIGGSGLIGTELARQLLNAGENVIILSRAPEKAEGIPAGASAEKWSSDNPEENIEVIGKSDAVVNLAGASIMRRWTASNKKKIRFSRINTGKILTESIERAGRKPEVVVQGSAFGYYGPGAREADESAGPGDDFLAEVAADWEDSTAAVEKMGVRRVIIRTGIVLSNRGGAFPLMKLPFRFLAGGPLGSGRQILSWIHIEDEAAAIRFLIRNRNAEGPFNLTSPEPVSNNKFSRILGKEMGRPSLIRVPGFLIRLVMGETSSVVLKGRAVRPRNLERLGFEFRFPDISSALEELISKKD